MNPLFRGVQGAPPNMMQIVNQVRQIRQNPANLPKILLDNGKISQEQYQLLQNQSPESIGNYLIQNGMMQQPFPNNPMVNQIQNLLN